MKYQSTIKVKINVHSEIIAIKLIANEKNILGSVSLADDLTLFITKKETLRKFGEIGLTLGLQPKHVLRWEFTHFLIPGLIV